MDQKPKSIAEVTAPNQEVTVTIGGQPYAAKTFNMLTIGRMQAVADAMPDPKPWKQEKANFLELRDIGVISNEEYVKRTEEAYKESASWPPQILGDPRANRLLFYNADMMAVVVAGSLRVPVEKATELLQDIDFELYQRIMNIGFNSPEIDAEEARPDPKADGALVLAPTG